MGAAPPRLGKYELQQHLGRGHVGEVWKARDLSLQCDVAIKIFYTDLQQSDPHFLTRFSTEGQVLVGLHHPNIVQVREVNVARAEQGTETTAYLSMDYIEGPTLADYLHATSHKGTFPSIEEIVYLFTTLGVAIDYAHQQGIVHGNIKPGNILLNKQDRNHFSAGEPLLADCGTNELLGGQGTIGAPHYVSPEQAKGDPASYRSDIYALGVILYEICTGVLPFRDESSVAVMMQHINTLPTPPILINPNIPPALSEVILRAMAKDPATRFSMASLLAGAIADACSMQSDLSLNRQRNTSSDAEDDEFSPGQPSHPSMPSILGVSQPLAKTPGQFIARPLPRLPAPQPSPQFSPAAHMPPPAPNMSGPLATDSAKLTAIRKQQFQATPVQSPAASPAMQHFLKEYQQPPVPTVQREQPISAPLAPLTSGPQPVLTPRTSHSPINPPISAPLTAPVQPLQTTSGPLGNPQSGTTAHLQVPKRPTAPPFQGSTPASNTRSLPTPLMVARSRLKFADTSVYVLIGSLLVLLLVIGSVFAASTFFNKGQTAATAFSGHVFFQDDALGRNDQLRIDIHNIAQPPDGKVYFAWLQALSQRTALPLGKLTVQNGTIAFLYPGDTQHTNLISIAQGVLITLEDSGSTPNVPGTDKAYQATFDTTLLSHLKELLYATPGLPPNHTALVDMFEAIKSVNDKAGSIVDTRVNDPHLSLRQATRIIEILDGSDYAGSSGDRPANVAPQLSIPIGLFSTPKKTGYLDMLDNQLSQLKQDAPDDQALQGHIQNVKTALADVKTWLQNLRTYDVQYLKAPDLQNPTMMDVALQIKQAAADSYIGRTIPPNQEPQLTSGSAGAQQAYIEAHYIATLNLQTP